MRAWKLLGLAFGLSLLTPTASADVPPPGIEECEGRDVGAACDVGGRAGSCQDSTCSRLDYSDGTPPSPVQYPCRLCVAGAAPTTSSGGCAAQPGGGSVAGLGVLAALLLGLRGRR